MILGELFLTRYAQHIYENRTNGRSSETTAIERANIGQMAPWLSELAKYRCVYSVQYEINTMMAPFLAVFALQIRLLSSHCLLEICRVNSQ